MLYGGIEAGGTKFVCAVADEKLQIKEKISIATTDPQTTFKQVFAFFDSTRSRKLRTYFSDS